MTLQADLPDGCQNPLWEDLDSGSQSYRLGVFRDEALIAVSDVSDVLIGESYAD